MQRIDRDIATDRPSACIHFKPLAERLSRRGLLRMVLKSRPTVPFVADRRADVEAVETRVEPSLERLRRSSDGDWRVEDRETANS